MCIVILLLFHVLQELYTQLLSPLLSLKSVLHVDIRQKQLECVSNVSSLSVESRLSTKNFNGCFCEHTHIDSHSPCLYSPFQVLHSSGQSLGSSWDVILNVIKAAATLTRWGQRSSTVHTCACIIYIAMISMCGCHGYLSSEVISIVL